MPLVGLLQQGLTGSVYGTTIASIRVVSPEHVIVLLALSIGAESCAAFELGCSWGLAHCAGNAIISGAFLAAEVMGFIDLPSFMQYFDCVTGGLLIFLGIYFLVYEEYYFYDTNVAKRSMTDLGFDLVDEVGRGGADADELRPLNPSGGQGSVADPTGATKGADEDAEALRSLNQCPRHSGTVVSVRVASAAILGFMQGFSDPFVIVGLGILSHMEPTQATILWFFVSYFVVSTVLAGLVTVLLAKSSSSVAGGKGATFLYRSSCVCAVIFGVVWLVAQLHCHRNSSCPAHGHHHR